MLRSGINPERSFLNAPAHVAEFYSVSSFHTARDGHKCAHRRHAVVRIRPMLRFAVNNRIRKAFDLQLVSVGIFAERTMKLAVLFRETLDHAALVIPRQKNLALHAAMFAINLKTLLEITAHWNREIEMAECAARIFHFDKPGEGCALLREPSPDTDDFT